ncbi:MAG: M23 family metallopeptidase [Deltaproteobacteria bacterium]|nr:M23 family metallopeptidase [Deltaproteobacteria bacterium]
MLSSISTFLTAAWLALSGSAGTMDDPRASAKEALVEFHGLALHAPLDGAPRSVLSGWGDARDNGRRRHKGLDWVSRQGEPVRAVAPGTILFAGVQRRRGRPRNLKGNSARGLRRSSMGPGGLFVMLRHDNGLVSCYMHLSEKRVQVGERVAAGQLLGRVGRTGIKSSDPHLHFELRYGGRHLNPARIFEPYLRFDERSERWRPRRRAKPRSKKRQPRVACHAPRPDRARSLGLATDEGHVRA